MCPHVTVNDKQQAKEIRNTAHHGGGQPTSHDTTITAIDPAASSTSHQSGKDYDDESQNNGHRSIDHCSDSQILESSMKE